jgi:DNA polymerase (family 10)
MLAAGPTKASFLVQPYDTQVDVRIVHPDEYGAALLYFTGSKAHNIQLRSMAKQRGWKINEYGVYDEATGHRLAGNDEAGIYALFGLKWIPPEERLGAGELESSKFRISQ